LGLAWWGTPVVPVLRRWRQENLKFEAGLGYIVSSRPPCATVQAISKKKNGA
jgi:hypothetical protein